MGAFNEKPFGNDKALDWLYDLELQDQKQFGQFLRSTIQKMLEDRGSDASIAEQAIAAIAVASAAATDPIGVCHKDAKALISKHGFVPDAALIKDCLLALQIVCHSEESDLRNLWVEAQGLTSWLKQTEKLANNLNAALLEGLPLREPKKPGMPRTLMKLIERYKEEPSDKIRQKIFEKFSALEDVNYLYSETGYDRPLHVAAVNGLLEETQLLINRGANVNSNKTGGNNQTPFETACIGGNLQVAELLRANGAQVFVSLDLSNNYGPTHSFVETARELGAALLPMGYRYCTALHIVAYKGTVPTLEYLVGLGADMCQLSLDLQNLAHFACKGNNIPILTYLRDKGFDLGQRIGKLGSQPLDSAVQRNAMEAVEFLLENGVDPNWVGPSLWTMYEKRRSPLDIARSPDLSLNKGIEKILLSYGAKTFEELENIEKENKLSKNPIPS